MKHLIFILISIPLFVSAQFTEQYKGDTWRQAREIDLIQERMIELQWVTIQGKAATATSIIFVARNQIPWFLPVTVLMSLAHTIHTEIANFRLKMIAKENREVFFNRNQKVAARW